MLRIYFGSEFDSAVYTNAGGSGVLYAGPKKLLRWLETQTGCSGYPENSDYLRIELYRQALQQYAAEAISAPFYADSFETDRFAAAQALLAYRDQLVGAGWQAIADAAAPERLRVFEQVEHIFRQKTADNSFSTGFADRWEAVLASLRGGNETGIDEFVLYEEEALQQAHVRRLIAVLREKNVSIRLQEWAPQAESGNLLWLQQYLTGAVKGKKDNDDDGTLTILRARRDSDAATFLAQLLAQTPDVQPVFLTPELNRQLEQALLMEGLPAQGVLSASLARPSLQVLKLAPAFLWEPVDVFKIMEFVTLPVKPLDAGLALEIARVLADRPGIFGENWYGAVLGYLDREGVGKEAREQYEFWFDRRRHRSDATAPKRDAIGLYAYLETWARAYHEQSGNKNPSLPVLAEQARRIKELLETLPEQRISYLELERIVRTIYEPAPVQFTSPEVGSFPFFHRPGACAAPAECMIWWNCLFDPYAPPPDFWRSEERAFLAEKNAAPDTPALQARLRLEQRRRPVLAAQKRLVLVAPEQAEGSEAVASLLFGDIEAAFEHPGRFSFHIDRAADRARLKGWFQIPDMTETSCRLGFRTRPVLEIAALDRLNRPDASDDYETPTGLENLFYFPHKWFFRQQLRLYPSSLLSVSASERLLGNLSHRFFEYLLRENFTTWNKSAVHEWMEEQARSLLPREGATLLMYGLEPERKTFMNKVKNAAWGLIESLRSNAWTVAHTELDLEGRFMGAPIRGKADLVLQRDAERAIVDFKWGGAKRRKELIQNEEDLQLTLYAYLLGAKDAWPHTAYFILEENKIIARNKLAFKEALTPGAHQDHAEANARILAKMEATFAWRMEQLRQGRLELRTARTAAELDFLYENEAMLHLLEMKKEGAKWDDYKTLLEFMG